MALDLGTLVGYLEIDPTKAKAGIAEGEAAIERFEKQGTAKAKVAGEKVGTGLGRGVTEGVKGEESKIRAAGEDAGDSFGDGVKSKIAALGLGAAVTASIMEGLDLDAAGDKLVASLGATHARGEKLTRLATDIYKGAWGESVDEVNLALGSVVTSMAGMRRASEKELTKATTKALDFASAFDVDVARSVQVAGTLMNTGLAKNATRAFDLMTRGSQKVPVQLREDLQDAVEEYGQFFSGLGYTGEQTFAMLVDASDKGIYGIDKMGDAVKEFTIRATDMSDASKDAYDAIGLDAEEMASKIIKGGDDAQDATRKVIDGLLSIEHPADRANTAIALFGTPLEDLNVGEVPKFLENLKGMSGSMDDFRGASRRMSNELNDNAKTKVTEFTRELKTGFVQWFADKGIPFIEDEVVPAFGKIGDALDELPDWAVKGTVGGLLGALLLGKVGNVAGGIKNLIPKSGPLGKVGKAGAVPVWVVNGGGVPGGGVPGAPVPGDSGSGKPGKGGAARSFARAVLPFLIADAGYEVLFDDLYGTLPDNSPDKGDRKPPSQHAATAFGIGLGPQSGQKHYDKTLGLMNDAFAKVKDSAAAADHKVRMFDASIDGLPEYSSLLFDTPGLGAAIDDAKRYKGILDGLDDRVVTTFLEVRQRKNEGMLGAPNRGGGVDSGETGFPRVTTSDLERVVSSMRPLYGDQTIMLQDWSGYERKREDDRRVASLSGRRG